MRCDFGMKNIKKEFNPEIEIIIIDDVLTVSDEDDNMEGWSPLI